MLALVCTAIMLALLCPPAAGAPPVPEVWFSPNVASVDMLDLFTAPQQWPAARSQVEVFKFDAGHVGTAGWSCDANPTQACGPNHISNFIAVDAFNTLDQWGIDIAIESFFAGPVMAVNPVTCSTPTHVSNLTLNGSINVIQSVEANGGTVHSLAIEEPIFQWMPAYYYLQTGQTDPRPCLTTSLDEVADYVAAYLQQMAVWFPNVEIGHIELYPEVGVQTLKDWVIALEARGVSIPFLHLDVHGPRVQQYINLGFDVDIADDFAELQTFLNARGIDFGVILIDLGWNAQLWEPGTYTDQTYYDGTMDWVNTIRATGGTPDHLIFQSWVKPYYTTGDGPKEVPVNLPEDDPAIYSHSRLISDALAVVASAPDTPSAGTRARAALKQNHPNPFTEATTIAYELDAPSQVSLKVYDVRGRLVQTLVDGHTGRGAHTHMFTPSSLPTGVYFYTLRVNDEHAATRKMLFIK